MRNDLYCKPLYVESLGFLIEYADSYEIAKNHGHEDGDTYPLFLGEKTILQSLAKEIDGDVLDNTHVDVLSLKPTTTSYPPLTYPIYLAQTYHNEERESIVYSFGYSPDNLEAKFGINTKTHKTHGANILETLGREPYEVAAKHLVELLQTNGGKFPQKFVVDENGIIESEQG